MTRISPPSWCPHPFLGDHSHSGAPRGTTHRSKRALQLQVDQSDALKRGWKDISIFLVGVRLDRRAMVIEAIWVLRAPRDIGRGRSIRFLSRRHVEEPSMQSGKQARESKAIQVDERREVG